MDYKQLRKRLCDLTGRSTSDVDSLVEGLSIILRDSCADLDNVAVPTFGTFEATKHNEEITTDLSTGRRMLMPPEITISFRPGGMLLKRLRNE